MLPEVQRQASFTTASQRCFLDDFSSNQDSASKSSNISNKLRGMKPLLYLANLFFDTFGITHPSAEKAHRAAQFLAVLLGVVILIFFAVAALGIYLIRTH